MPSCSALPQPQLHVPPQPSPPPHLSQHTTVYCSKHFDSWAPDDFPLPNAAFASASEMRPQNCTPVPLQRSTLFNPPTPLATSLPSRLYSRLPKRATSSHLQRHRCSESRVAEILADQWWASQALSHDVHPSASHCGYFEGSIMLILIWELTLPPKRRRG